MQRNDTDTEWETKTISGKNKTLQLDGKGGVSAQPMEPHYVTGVSVGGDTEKFTLNTDSGSYFYLTHGDENNNQGTLEIIGSPLDLQEINAFVYSDFGNFTMSFAQTFTSNIEFSVRIDQGSRTYVIAKNDTPGDEENTNYLVVASSLDRFRLNYW